MHREVIGELGAQNRTLVTKFQDTSKAYLSKKFTEYDCHPKAEAEAEETPSFAFTKIYNTN